MTFQRLQTLAMEAHEQSKPIPVKCCGCNRVCVDGHWGRAPTTATQTLYSHGYCPSCYVSAMSQLSLCRAVTQ